MNNPFNKEYFASIDYRNKGLPSIFSDMRKVQEKVSKSIHWFHPLMSTILNLPKNSIILDVGCGNCLFLSAVHFHRPDIQLHGCDIGNIEDTPDYIKFKQCSGDKLLYEDNTFDCIICTQVFEHIPNPLDFLIEFKRCIKKGGYTYIDTPSHRMLRMPDQANFYNDPTHIRPYTQTGLKRLGILSGLQTLKSNNCRNYPINILILTLVSPLLLVLNIFGKDLGYFNDWLSSFFGTGIYWIGTKHD